MNCLCGCVEKNDGEKRKDNKRIRLVTYLCDIMEVDSESDYETVEVTYVEASAMSNCEEGIYHLNRYSYSFFLYIIEFNTNFEPGYQIDFTFNYIEL